MTLFLTSIKFEPKLRAVLLGPAVLSANVRLDAGTVVIVDAVRVSGLDYLELHVCSPRRFWLDAGLFKFEVKA